MDETGFDDLSPDEKRIIYDECIKNLNFCSVRATNRTNLVIADMKFYDEKKDEPIASDEVREYCDNAFPPLRMVIGRSDDAKVFIIKMKEYIDREILWYSIRPMHKKALNDCTLILYDTFNIDDVSRLETYHGPMTDGFIISDDTPYLNDFPDSIDEIEDWDINTLYNVYRSRKNLNRINPHYALEKVLQILDAKYQIVKSPDLSRPIQVVDFYIYLKLSSYVMAIPTHSAIDVGMIALISESELEKLHSSYDVHVQDSDYFSGLIITEVDDYQQQIRTLYPQVVHRLKCLDYCHNNPL